MMVHPVILVACGGAVGAVLRYLVGQAMGRMSTFPYGTLTVNIAGSFLMGVLVAVMARYTTLSQQVYWLVAVGMLGSFTTFSTFSLNVVYMLERGEMAKAGIYIVASCVGAIIALWLGMLCVRGLAG